LNIVRPHRLYLGEKDGQQLAVIQKLVQDLCLPVEVVPCATVRESNGLASSSRNQYLTPEQKQTASHIYRGLERAYTAFKQGERQRQNLIAQVELELADYPELALEYVDLVSAETLIPLAQLEEGTVGLLAVAVKLGTTRLIDNIRLVCRRPIIAIDGPAGAGKSTVTSRVAQELGLLHLDTGAMYRSIALAVLQAGIDPQDSSAVAEIAHQTPIELLPVHPLEVLIHGQNVTHAIRSSAVTKLVPTIAAQPAVRQILEKSQRHFGKKGGIVIEGRDIGTRIFPDAELKIFLTASVAERALRRQQELRIKGEVVSLEELTQSIQERDYRDSTREVSPLRKADNAILINSDGISVDEVVAEIIRLYRQVCHD
jgi:pantoate ligase/cytidylate kinase